MEAGRNWTGEGLPLGEYDTAHRCRVRKLDRRGAHIRGGRQDTSWKRGKTGQEGGPHQGRMTRYIMEGGKNWTGGGPTLGEDDKEHHGREWKLNRRGAHNRGGWLSE